MANPDGHEQFSTRPSCRIFTNCASRLCTSATEGAKLWLQILTELRQRGVKDMIIACVDGLKGFPEAIEAAFPKTTVQLCIVHMVRNSLAM